MKRNHVIDLDWLCAGPMVNGKRFIGPRRLNGVNKINSLDSPSGMEEKKRKRKKNIIEPEQVEK